MKSIFTNHLTVITIFFLFNFNLVSAQTTYTLTDDDVVVSNGNIISCSYDFSIKDIIIPDVLDGQTIIAIKNGYSSSQGVFAYSGVESVQLPTTLELIGDYAFYKASLKSLNIPNNVTTIGKYAFQENSLSQLHIPNTVTLIKEVAFYRNNIETVEISTGLEEIERYVFSGNNLTSVMIPNNVTSIGERAFSSNSIENVTIPNRVAFIGKYAFDNNFLSSVNFESSSSLLTISENAFSNNNLTGINLPSSHINSDIEWYDNAGNFYEIGNEISNFSSSYDQPYILTDDDVVVEDGVIVSCNLDGYTNKNILIPSTLDGQIVTKLGYRSFADKDFWNVRFPSTLTFIGGYSFYRVPVKSIKLGNNIITIDFGAFQDNDLKEVDLPNGLITIGDGAFGSNELESIVIPSSVTSIGASAFGNNALKNVQIPESVNKLDDYVFENNELTTITIPSTVTEIGIEAFASNYISDIVIPNSVITVGYRAFLNNNLANVEFLENSNLEFIGNNAFSENQNLLSIQLPISQTDPNFINWFDENGNAISCGEIINDFETYYRVPYTLRDNDVKMTGGCITKCTYDFSNKHIVIPSILNNQIVTKLVGSYYENGSWSYPFKDKGLINVLLPETVQEIGDNSFQTNNIRFLDIPSSVSIIGEKAFYSNSLTSLNVPSSIEFIGDEAFSNNQLSSVFFEESSNLLSIGFKAFYENNLLNITLPNSYDKTGFNYWQDDLRNKYVCGDSFTDFVSSYISPYTLNNSDVEVENGVIITCSYDFKRRQIIIPSLLDGQTIIGIGENCFKEREIFGVELPNTLISINNNSFQYNLIKSLNIPNSVQQIGEFAFASNRGNGNDYNKWYPRGIQEINFEANSNLSIIGERAFYANKIINLTIPSSVSVIDDYAFCTNEIQNLVFEDNSKLNRIGGLAFLNNSIISVVIPKTVECVGPGAFEDNRLSHVEFENNSSLNLIGASAFDDNPDLTTFTLPSIHTNTIVNNFTDIYSKLYNLGDVITNPNSTLTAVPYTVMDIDVYMNDGTITNFIPRYTYNYKKIIIPSELKGQTVTGIKDGFDNKSIQEVQLPNTLLTLEDYAFFNNKLSSVSIPGSVTLIGEKAFANNLLIDVNFEQASTSNYQLKSNQFNSGIINIETISDYAFDNNLLVNLYIPNSVSRIGDNAFSNNTLESVSFEANSILSEIGFDAFINNPNLSTLTLPIREKEGYSFLGWKDDVDILYHVDESISDFSRAYYPYFEQFATDGINIRNDRICIYPNPVKDNLCIDLGSKSSIKFLEIRDLLGKIHYYDIIESQKKLRINMKNYSTGIYMLKLTSNNGSLIIKKVIKR